MRVFISYASDDLACAEELHQTLTGDGHQVFLDRHRRDGIGAGDDWKQQLYQRLRWADALVCVLTPTYADHTWCFAEVAVAQTLGRPILPLAAAVGSRHPLLDAVQQIDYVVEPAAGRAQLLASLRRLEAGGRSGWSDERSPFPGLRPFDAELHQVFFGRGEEIKVTTALLRSPAEQAAAQLLLVVGPSGCGKSSLVRAGVVPTIARESDWWTLPPLSPTGSGGTADPVRELARTIAEEARNVGLVWTFDAVLSWLAEDGGLAGIVDELLVAAPGRARRLLLVVDQCEELLIRTSSDRRAAFAGLLRQAMAGPVSVIGTLRPEFLAQFQADQDLSDVPVRLVELRPLDQGALATVVEQPARLAGIGVDPELVGQLVGDTGSGEALPLLAFTLEQLARGVTRGGRLSLDRYWELGGVAGALIGQANAALEAARRIGGRSSEDVINGLLRLVTVDEQGRPAGWQVGRDDLSDQAWAELAEFVSRRLLVTVARDNGVVLGVAHEAFLSAWQPLADAINETAVALRAQRSIELAAREWDLAGRTTAHLWEGAQLTRATAVAPGRVTLSRPAQDFLRAGTRRARFRRARAFVVLSILLVAALVATAIAVVNQRQAENQQRIANAQSLAAQADAIRDRDPRLALRLALAAERINADNRTRASLIDTLTATRYAGTLTDSGFAAAFSPDSRTVATASSEGGLILWDTADRRQIGEPLRGLDGTEALAFSPDGRTLVASGTDLAQGRSVSMVVVWDVTDREHLRRNGEPVTNLGGILAFAPKAPIMALANRSVTLWDFGDRDHPRQIGQPFVGTTGGDNVVVHACAFSPDGRTLATAGSNNTVTMWDVTDPQHPRQLGQPIADHREAVLTVTFAPDGKTMATGGRDDSAIIYDVSDRTSPRRIGEPLTAHTNAVSAVRFSPDGATLATASHDNSAILWDITKRDRPRRIGRPVAGQTNGINDVAFAPDGSLLITAAHDNTVVLWDLLGRNQPRRVGPSIPTGGVYVGPLASFAPDGRILGVLGPKGEAHLWNVTDRERPIRPAQPLLDTGAARSIAFAPRGQLLATVSEDEEVRLWDVGDLAGVRQVGGPLPARGTRPREVVFSPNGAILVVTDLDTGVGLWDVTDPGSPRALGKPIAGMRSVVFMPDGLTLVTAMNGEVELWAVNDPVRPRLLSQFNAGHTADVSALAIAPDGRTLATASSDTTVVIWDVADRERPRRLGRPLIDHTYTVKSAVFAPDGHTLATASFDATVMLWDMTDRERPRRLGEPLIGHSTGVSSAVFAPDGRTLATASLDGTTVLWDLTGMNELRSHAVERACSLAGSGLTPDEWARHVPLLPYRESCP